MRNNYHIKLNPKRPSSEDIARHMDFDGLMEKFREEKPASRPALRIRRLYIAGAAVAAALALLIIARFLAPAAGTAPQSAEQYFARQEFVEPPLETIQPQHIRHQLNADKGGTIEFSSGSRLVVPSQAFLDDRGNLVEGEVDIHYREMHDFVDFFIGGIPMVYDSAGQRYFLESAGMVEIFALQDGRRISLAPGKAIAVELVSEITLPNINVTPQFYIYRLDTAQRRWVYQNIDHIQFLEGGETLDEQDPLYGPKAELLEELRNIEIRADRELAGLESTLPLPVEPVKPLRQERGKQSLGLEGLSEAARSASGEQFDDGTPWQISPRSPAFDQEALQNEKWDDFVVRPVNNLEFELTLIRGNRRMSMLIMPVLAGNDFDRALRRYEAALAEYQAKLAKRKTDLSELRKATLDRLAQQKKNAQLAFERRVDSMELQGLDELDTGIRRRIVNRFSVTSLGIWNCDRPVLLEGEEMKAKFVDQHGNNYPRQTVYLAQRGQNTIFRFYTGDEILLDLQAESLIWVVDEENKIALMSAEDLSRLSENPGRPTLLLRLTEKPVEQEEELRNLLKF